MQIEQPEIYMEDVVEVINPYTGESMGKNLVVKQNLQSSAETVPHWIFFDPEQNNLIATGQEMIVIKSYKRDR